MRGTSSVEAQIYLERFDRKASLIRLPSENNGHLVNICVIQANLNSTYFSLSFIWQILPVRKGSAFSVQDSLDRALFRFDVMIHDRLSRNSR